MAQPNLGTNMKREADGIGVVRAIDPHTGEKKWEYKMTDITWAGVLTTASDLLFSGGPRSDIFMRSTRRPARCSGSSPPAAK